MKRKLNCILLIEDDAATNYLHTRVLKMAGCTEQIATADNGQEALKLLHTLASENKPAPELILLDINMPVMNAWEFLEAYNRLPENEKGSTKIIMLTTSLNSDDEVRAGAMPGINGYYMKPLDSTMLDEILEKHFAVLM